MKSTLAGVSALLALGGCASASGEGTTADWGANSWVNAADLGEGRWFITCTNAMSACTDRARSICTNGFDLLNMDSVSVPVAAGNQYGFSAGAQQNFQLAVACRTA